MPVAGALLVATVAAVLLRTGDLSDSFWIDEAISGDSEAAARSLSLLFAALAVPVSYWAATAIAGRRAGVVAVALAVGSPFLTYYAQEARMYTLVAVLSLVATAAFVRGHRVTLVVSLVLLLYTHTWGVFLAAALVVARREYAIVAAAVALVYAPWLPSLVVQALHTGAPWSARPSPAVLAALVAAAALAWRGRSDTVRLLALVATGGAALAWLASQLEPAWSPRYLAVLYGPAVLAVACGVARRPPWAVAAVAVAAVGLVAVPLPPKSNARAVAVSAGIGLRPGDLVVSTQPEQLPVLHRYLPPGAVYLTPLGAPPDPSVMDWRDALRRLRSELRPRPRLAPGRRIVLVTPVVHGPPRSPWARAVRARTIQWRTALRHDPRLRRLRATSRLQPCRYRSAVYAEVFEVAGIPACRTGSCMQWTPPTAAPVTTSARYPTPSSLPTGR